MFCKNCGSEVGNQNFCANCGEKIEAKKEDINKASENAEVVENVTSNFEEVAKPVVVAKANVEDSKNGNYEQVNNEINYSSKSKVAAGLFGIFLGAFGVHNFYLGYTGKAVAQLLISILSCGTLLVVSEIWGLIEGIMIFASKDYKDAEGKILRD